MEDVQSTPRTKQRHSRRPEYVVEDPLLNVREAAAESGRAVSTFWRDSKAGILPSPIYISRKCPRWRRSAIRAAVADFNTENLALKA